MPYVQRFCFTRCSVFAPQSLRLHRTHRPLEAREWKTGSAATTDACTSVRWKVIALPVLRNVRKINLRQPNASLQPDTLQTTCLLLKQKITGLPRRSAQRVGGSEAGQGRQFPARGSRGIADPPDSESGSLGRASRLAPTNFTPKHFERCTS